MIRVLRVWIVAVVLMVPQSVLACAVCFGGEDDNRQAFIDTTVILTVAPLIIVGLFIWMLIRRISKVEKLRQEQLAADQREHQISTSSAEVS